MKTCPTCKETFAAANARRITREQCADIFHYCWDCTWDERKNKWGLRCDFHAAMRADCRHADCGRDVDLAAACAKWRRIWMQSGGNVNDEELIEYTDAHCRTERALFHRDHVARMYALAGRPVTTELPEWVSWHSYNGALAVVREARLALAARSRSAP